MAHTMIIVFGSSFCSISLYIFSPSVRKNFLYFKVLGMYLIFISLHTLGLVVLLSRFIIDFGVLLVMIEWMVVIIEWLTMSLIWSHLHLDSI